jgi:hypothetical protein
VGLEIGWAGAKTGFDWLGDERCGAMRGDSGAVDQEAGLASLREEGVRSSLSALHLRAFCQERPWLQLLRHLSRCFSPHRPLLSF